MNTIQPFGGGDYEEAIEIGMWHVLNQHSIKPVDYVILIGDAPAKSLDAVERDRKKDENIWLQKFG